MTGFVFLEIGVAPIVLSVFRLQPPRRIHRTLREQIESTFRRKIDCGVMLGNASMSSLNLTPTVQCTVALIRCVPAVYSASFKIYCTLYGIYMNVYNLSRRPAGGSELQKRSSMVHTIRLAGTLAPPVRWQPQRSTNAHWEHERAPRTSASRFPFLKGEGRGEGEESVRHTTVHPARSEAIRAHP